MSASSSNPLHTPGRSGAPVRPRTRALLLLLATGGAFSAATAMAGTTARTGAIRDASSAAPRKVSPRTATKAARGFVKRATGVGSKGSGATKPPGTCVIKTSDIIRDKIDIGAQYSLMRKMNGDPASRREASSMIKAIEDGRLAGILLPPRKAVSDRGARMSPPRGHWELIPKGKNSTCLKQPAGEPPMIVYRTEMSNQKIDAALTSAWEECGLLNLPVACDYVVDRHKPEVECKTDGDCIGKKGDFCNTATNTCGIEFPDDHVPGPTCAYPQCDASVSTSVYAACDYESTGVPVACLPRAGSRCGACDNVSSKAKQCHDKNEARHKAENQRCRDQHSPAKTGKYGIECAKHAAACESGSLSGCAEFAKCVASPEPHNEYRKCLDRESARYLSEGARCRAL